MRMLLHLRHTYKPVQGVRMGKRWDYEHQAQCHCGRKAYCGPEFVCKEPQCWLGCVS